MRLQSKVIGSMSVFIGLFLVVSYSVMLISSIHGFFYLVFFFPLNTLKNYVLAIIFNPKVEFVSDLEEQEHCRKCKDQIVDIGKDHG